MSFPPVPPSAASMATTPGGLPFSPQRDIAYCFGPLVAVMLNHADADNAQSPESQWLLSHGVDAPELGDALGKLTDAISTFVKHNKASCQIAFDDAGWQDVPVAVRVGLLAMFGELFLSAYCSAMKDVTQVGHMPPQESQLPEVVGRLRCRALSLLAVSDQLSPTVEAANVVRRQTEAELQLALKTVEQLQQQVQELKKA